MTLSQIDVIGSVLAPNASLENPNGHLSGQIFARNWNGTLEIGNQTFNGCLPSKYLNNSYQLYIPLDIDIDIDLDYD